MKLKIFCLLVVLFLIIPCAKKVYPYSGSHAGILGCGDCHTKYPYAITTFQGNVNLCLSCHTGGAMASNLALYSVDQATITERGIYGKSHRWDGVGYQVNVATLPMTFRTTTLGGVATNILDWTRSTRDGTPVYSRLFSDGQNLRLACSSCHNSRTASFLRNERERDQKLCLECHWADKDRLPDAKNSANFVNGPVDHSTRVTGNVYVGCSSCHVIHSR